MFQLSYDVAAAITEEDHAAVHLINRLLRAQDQHQAPIEAMDHALVRNAVKNPVEIDRAARLFYEHVLLTTASQMLTTSNAQLADHLVLTTSNAQLADHLAAVFLPLGLALVGQAYADANGPGFAGDTAWPDRLALAFQRLCEAMHPGFAVMRQGMIRPGEADAHTVHRLLMGLILGQILRDMRKEMDGTTFFREFFDHHPQYGQAQAAQPVPEAVA